MAINTGMSFLFGGDTGETPETLKRKREIAQALAAYDRPQNVGEGIGAIARGLAAGVMNYRAGAAEKAGRAGATDAFSKIVGALNSPAKSSAANIPSSDVSAELSGSSPSASNPSSIPTSLLSAIDSTEGAGSYDTLYGHAQKEGPFAGTDVSKMTIGEALAFADPSGPYGQQVKAQIGRVATPMGRYQIVGTTLKNAVQDLGLDPSMPFDANTQDTIATHLAKQRISSADTLDGKISALRSEWHGLKNVPRNQMAQIVADLENGGTMAAAQGNAEVASLDPSIGMPGAAQEVAATSPAAYRDPAVAAPNSRVASPADVAALPPAREVATPPVPPTAGAAPAPIATPSREVAQALVRPQQAGPSMNDLMSLAQNPWLTDSQAGIVNALMKGQISQQQAERELLLQQSDPKYKLELEKLKAEAENLRNPKMTPAEEARLGLDRDKFAFEKQGAGLTDDIREYNFYAEQEKAAGREPLPPDQFWQTMKKSGAQNITVGGEGDSFYKELDKKNAEQFASLSTGGIEARAKLAQIDRLQGLFANAPQGAEGYLKKVAGDYGIATEGLSDIQAASSLLEKMVPAQRPPGSGPMSDADINMFRASLPRILNQPGGNQLIFDTMRGIAMYEQQMGEIADRVAAREISPTEAREQIRGLANPLADFKIPEGKTPNEGWSEIAPTIRFRKIEAGK